MTPRHPCRAAGVATLTVSVTTAAVVALTGCGSAGSGAGGDGPPTVVASTDVWGSVVRAIAGDTVDVKTIIDDPSADPHSYESTPQDAAEITRADLVVFNGGGYDGFIEQILDSGDPDTPTVEAFALTAEGQERADEGGHSNEDGPNEHVWYDLETAEAVARNVARQLSTLAPQHEETFTASTREFNRRIDGLVERVSAIEQQHSGDRIAVTEPVATYLVEATGLSDVTSPDFVEAVEGETDPPAAAVAETRRLLADNRVDVLVFNPQAETPVTGQVRSDAEAAGIPVVAMTETLPEGTGYLDWMSGQVDALAAALQR
ncbi:MAG: metal ABC transporter solute-binding protein, Zn/Mn family [Pseudonocardiaceae bacterium]